MPYIVDNTIKKTRFNVFITKLVDLIESKGDINYVICELIARIILRDGISYTRMSERIDAVHDAECELRRRLLDPYEDLKIIENGDVPGFTEILKKI